MAQNVTVSLPGLIIAISVVILLILFWLFSRNTIRITTALDNKQSLEHQVSALADMLGHVATSSSAPLPDTTRGSMLTPQSAPHMYSLLDAMEATKLHNSDRVYLFLLDARGNMIMNGGAPHIAKRGAHARPGNNLMDYVDADGNKAVQAILSKAASGGGYVEYKWPCPRTKQSVKKLSYVKPVPHTPWILGAGLYIDKSG